MKTIFHLFLFCFPLTYLLPNDAENCCCPIFLTCDALVWKPHTTSIDYIITADGLAYTPTNTPKIKKNIKSVLVKWHYGLRLGLGFNLASLIKLSLHHTYLNKEWKSYENLTSHPSIIPSQAYPPDMEKKGGLAELDPFLNEAACKYHFKIHMLDAKIHLPNNLFLEDMIRFIFSYKISVLQQKMVITYASQNNLTPRFIQQKNTTVLFGPLAGFNFSYENICGYPCISYHSQTLVGIAQTKSDSFHKILKAQNVSQLTYVPDSFQGRVEEKDKRLLLQTATRSAINISFSCWCCAKVDMQIGHEINHWCSLKDFLHFTELESKNTLGNIHQNLFLQNFFVQLKLSY